ncbi:relaxase/mobilization nuclease domain-containing protein [Escherichia coli]|nr:relaxase/mobilization nuclease domain-containing protein [Escherichia coli]EFI8595778.1 relaxase/mobilization nuclease domain-containing protein [Escherichia coli]
MIAKRVPRTKATSSTARLVRYMVAAAGDIDPNTWARTADYILDTKESTHKGEKVDSYRVTNCGTDDPAAAAIAIEAIQAANIRSKADKTYHMVYSFPPGEHPSLEVLHAIEDELCAAIGFADHQRVSAVHKDTDHLHVHVAINKVHPTGLQNIEPYYDKKQLMRACERLEIKFDLQRTNHGIEDKDHDNSRDGQRIRLNPGQRPEQRDSRFRRYLRESGNLSFADEPEAKTLNGMRTLSGCRLVRASERSPVLLPRHTRSDLQQRGEERPDSVRRPGHGDRAATSETGGSGRTRVGGKAADIEAQSGIETLTGYAAREVAPALRAATSWQELHDAAAEHGLQVRQRGAGLVIGDPDLDLWAKCSNVGRDLSSKALTDRLGPFEPTKEQAEAKAARKRYEAKPRRPERPDGPATSTLFAQYQRERQAAIVGRRQGMDAIKRDSASASAQLRNWSQTQRMLVKVAAKGAAKKIMYSTIKQQTDAARNANRQNAAARRETLFKQTTMPTWADWLTQQAERGNAEALAVLRDREDRQRKWQGDLLTANRADRAKSIVLDKLKPKARKDGSMAYSTIDGGMVIDRNTHVQAQKATTGAALVALELASKRFDGQPLVVEGTAEFRQEVAMLAGMHGFNVRFADPDMEQLRRDTAEHKAMEQEANRFSELADFGKAPFEHVKGNRKSYFVTLRDQSGEEHTIWGVGLESAMARSGAAVGDRVNVEHVGSENVTLPDGRNFDRHSWNVEVAPKDSQAPKPTRKPPRAAPKPDDMEAEFLAATGLSGKTPKTRTPAKPAQPVASSPAVEKWIEDRNKKRDKISSLNYHREWQETDAGKVSYQGRRRMEDGSEVLLLKRGDEMLVKPSTARVVAKATQWKIGSEVELDARGRFKDSTKGRSKGKGAPTNEH